MVVRCPYCVRSDDFMIMNVDSEGLYVCPKCRHTVVPENKRFRCGCDHCVALDAFHPYGQLAWLPSA